MPLEDIFHPEAHDGPVRPWHGDGAAAAACMGGQWR